MLKVLYVFYTFLSLYSLYSLHVSSVEMELTTLGCEKLAFSHMFQNQSQDTFVQAVF
jgi:hypothetical protein